MNESQVKKYRFQQTKFGKETIEILEKMRESYYSKFNMRKGTIKIGKVTPLVNGRTGLIDKFIED